jgi:hypothetical protein
VEANFTGRLTPLNGTDVCACVRAYAEERQSVTRSNGGGDGDKAERGGPVSRRPMFICAGQQTGDSSL